PQSTVDAPSEPRAPAAARGGTSREVAVLASECSLASANSFRSSLEQGPSGDHSNRTAGAADEYMKAMDEERTTANKAKNGIGNSGRRSFLVLRMRPKDGNRGRGHDRLRECDLAIAAAKLGQDSGMVSRVF